MISAFVGQDLVAEVGEQTTVFQGEIHIQVELVYKISRISLVARTIAYGK